MNYICTWFCADEKGEESLFPQTGQASSGQNHQDIYWRCLLLFFSTSLRLNKTEQHLLFTNVKKMPVVDGRKVEDVLRQFEVQTIYTPFSYKTPRGYFGMFQNQFYEFSILQHITETNSNPDDHYLIVDSDCVFIKPAALLFEEAAATGFLSFEDDCTHELVIHGLNRMDMQVLYEDLLQTPVQEVPGYHLGEFLLASVANLQIIYAGFKELWPELLRRNLAGLPKFNEEAQTLSYLYYKNGLKASPRRDLMKRIWTNPVFYRNVEASDLDLVLWHLPAEKTFGIAALYQLLIDQSPEYGIYLSPEVILPALQEKLGIPELSAAMKMRYYSISYTRAIRKRIKNIIT